MRRAMLCLALGVLLDASSGFAQGSIYWTNPDSGAIRRANLDGSGATDLLTATGIPHSIALDVAGGKMYWADGSDGTLRRADLDGSGAEVLVDLSPHAAGGLALDPGAGQMYWTQVNALIRRADLDGTSPVDLATVGGGPLGIALDLAAGQMYWAEGSIHRANTDGTGVTELVFGLENPHTVALDVAGGKIYWTHPTDNAVQRANLADGSGVETLVSDQDPRGIALDLAAGKMYWTNNDSGTLRRANLDGSGVEDVVTDGTATGGLALDVASGAPVTFAGLGHTTLGSASLLVDSSGLVVSGFGASGADGVSVGLGEAEFGRMDLASLGPLAPGESVKSRAKGALDGVLDETLAELLLIGMPDGKTRLEADLSPVGIVRPCFLVYDGPTEVFRGEIVDNSLEIAGQVNPCFLPYQPVGAADAAATLLLGGSHEITIGGGGPVVHGDRIVALAEGVTKSVGPVSSLALTAVGLSSLTVTGEAVGMFGVSHQAVGQALLAAAPGQLTVSNLGPDLGGTSVGLAGNVTPDYGVELQPLALTGGAGKAVRLEATGSVGGVPAVFGTLDLVASGAGVDVVVDYAGAGATMVEVEVFNGGTLVGTATVPAGLVGTLTAASGSVALTSGVTSYVNPCMIVGFSGPVTLTLAGGAPFAAAAGDAAGPGSARASKAKKKKPRPLVGDELHFDGVGAAGAVESLLGLSIQARNVGSFTLVGAGSPSAAPTVEERLQALIDTVYGLPTSAFRKKNDKKTLLNKLAAIQKQVEKGAYCAARAKLLNDILPRTDGETPPKDWVTDPAAQEDLEKQILALAAQLEAAVPGGC